MHLIDADPHCVFGRERLHLGQRFTLDFLAADSDHLVDGAVADNFAHHGFGHIAEGFAWLADFEKEFGGIGDAVLNDPFHQCGVQVARHHLCFPLFVARARTLVRIGCARGGEPEFLLELPFDGDDRRRVNAQRQLEMQSRRNVFEIFAEALHDGDGIARHGVIGCPCAPCA